MFNGRFPCQQAHKLGERLLRFWSLCQHYPCSGHTSVVLRLSAGTYEIHVMLHAGFMKSDSPPPGCDCHKASVICGRSSERYSGIIVHT
jgi:hypothetical protein